MSNVTSTSSAVEIVEALGAGDVKASDVAKSVLSDISRIDGALNCYTRVLEDLAIDQAGKVDAAISRGENPGAMAGVPFAVKDLFDVAGQTTTAGAKILESEKPASRDAIVVERLKKAGAILVGTSNMDEFAYGFATDNAHYGVTRNPFDTDRLAGGSSGGSAAAVASGLAAIALGSDTNGSVRVPASLCGIYGLRPTYDHLPLDGVFPFVKRLDTVGIFARTIADVELSFAVLSEKSMHTPLPEKLKIGRLGGWFERNAETEGSRAIDLAAECLSAQQMCTLDLAEAARSAAFLLTASEGAQLHMDRLSWDPLGFDSAVRDRLLAGAKMPRHYVLKAERIASSFIAQVLKALEEFDVLIAPSTPTVAPGIDDGLIEIDKRMVSARANLGIYTQPISLAGVPALSVPLKRNGSLPFGIQLIAGRGREPFLFEAARQLEKAGIAEFEPPKIWAGRSA